MTTSSAYSQVSFEGETNPGEYRILVACETTGTVRNAFTNIGFTGTVSCDIKPSQTSGAHIQGDVLPLLSEPWDLIIGHPPCTYLCVAGIAHWYKPGREKKRKEAIAFFYKHLEANATHIAVENPRMPLSRLIGDMRAPDQTIQPWQYGHPWTKLTCFWLKNLPHLRPTHTYTSSGTRC